MRIGVSWLREYVSLPAELSADDIAAKFISIGFEVEDIHLGEPVVGDLVVGRVATIEELTEFKKPIRFCTVDVGPGNGPDGSDGVREIICGATNFVVGDLVVVALPGTVLPGGFTIASRQTYGHLSDGMICAEDEIGVGTDHAGILVLGHGEVDGVEPGADARSLVGVGDPVIEVNVETDRGYAMSMRGLARELGTAFGVEFVDPAQAPLRTAAGDAQPVRLDDPSGCSRFVAVRITGTDPLAASPLVIRKRLAAAKIRSISLVVDVTNYVMLELGQPLHAYDAAKLQGAIGVRRAAAGERVRTLDGVDRPLNGGEVVITDDSGIIGLAGVMGGESTEISAGTSEVVIEAATFTAADISRTSRRHRLPSEAAKRFERSVDPAVAPAAAERAAALITRYGGGTVDAGRTDVGDVQEAAPVRMSLSEPERLVGRPFSADTVQRRLEQVGCTVELEVARGSVVATPPSWRPDLLRPADLVEEVARLEGFDTIPSVLPGAPAGSGFTPRQRRARAVADLLADRGLVESQSFPFIGTADLDALNISAGDTRRRLVTLANPLDAGRPYLRTSLLPGLLDVVRRNLARGAKSLALFEIGQVFLPRHGAPSMPDLAVDRRPTPPELAVAEAALPDQPRRLGAVLVGDWDRVGWWGAGRAADFSDAIEIARGVAAACGHAVRVVASDLAPFHPGRAGELRVGDWPIGVAGELHPAVVERLGLPRRAVALELTLDAIPDAPAPTAPAVSPFPPALVDVALVVPERVAAADLAQALKAGGGELLESVRLFDVYTGGQVAAGHRSLAFALSVRAIDHTLTAAEANAVRDAAIRAAADAFGATVRE
ncbi:MAG: phenylalanine--tRNA ligase subunit beta [Nakamurella sp.]